VDLTGGTAETLSLIGMDAENLWSKVQRALEEGWLMGTAATTAGVLGSEAEIDGMGLVGAFCVVPFGCVCMCECECVCLYA
jgi:hypothetical protein